MQYIENAHFLQCICNVTEYENPRSMDPKKLLTVHYCGLWKIWVQRFCKFNDSLIKMLDEKSIFSWKLQSRIFILIQSIANQNTIGLRNLHLYVCLSIWSRIRTRIHISGFGQSVYTDRPFVQFMFSPNIRFMCQNDVCIHPYKWCVIQSVLNGLFHIFIRVLNSRNELKRVSTKLCVFTSIQSEM